VPGNISIAPARGRGLPSWHPKKEIHRHPILARHNGAATPHVLRFPSHAQQQRRGAFQIQPHEGAPDPVNRHAVQVNGKATIRKRPNWHGANRLRFESEFRIAEHEQRPEVAGQAAGLKVNDPARSIDQMCRFAQ
jgi:hypothetical protein